jgi:streptogramin lyase
VFFTSKVIREKEAVVPMMFRQFFTWGAMGTGAKRRHAARGRDVVSRVLRPEVESLEGRQLLAALTQFPLSSNQSAGAALTLGPDGNLWFPEQEGAGEIVRITPAGVSNSFLLPVNYSSPSALTVGPDNNLWFTDLFNTNGKNVPAVGQINSAGVVTEYPTHSSYSSTSALTVGPDNNLWFTESSPSSSGVTAATVGQVTPAGVVSEFPLPITNNVVSGLTDGPDGHLWFSASTSTNSSASASIGRITPGGVISEFGLPSTYYLASALTTGRDGNLWFSNQTNSPPSSSAGKAAIGRITPTGTVSEYSLSSSATSASPLTVGPDGNLWFSEFGSPFESGLISTPSSIRIGQITPAGAITDFPLAPTIGPGYPYPSASALTVGPDNSLYFTITAAYDVETFPLGNTPAGYILVRVTPAGDVIEFAGASVSSFSESLTTFAPTVGSDGNIWFPDGSNIGRLDRGLVTPDQEIPPTITLAKFTDTKKGLTTIVLHFDEAMVPGPASARTPYSLASGVKKHHMLVYSKAVKIRSLSYDANAETVTITLAKPFRGNVQVTVRAGIVATNGTSTQGNASMVVVFIP